jgi:hypothetical protein
MEPQAKSRFYQPLSNDVPATLSLFDQCAEGLGQNIPEANLVMLNCLNSYDPRVTPAVIHVLTNGSATAQAALVEMLPHIANQQKDSILQAMLDKGDPLREMAVKIIMSILYGRQCGCSGCSICC